MLNSCPKVSLSKLKDSAKKLCDRLKLSGMVRAIDKSKNNFLNIFFSAEIHKVDVPFRTIVRNATSTLCVHGSTP